MSSENPIRRFIGPATTRVRLREIFVSGVSALLAIAAVHALTAQAAGEQAAIFMVASMGAAAVLLFAVPHGALSQPWPVFGGQAVSAVIGVTAAQWIADPALAAGIAVGGAIAAMQLLRCVHPPGGATALVAVIGGPAVHELGYGFVILPVLANTLIIFGAAVVANWPFPWRRYPIGLARFEEPPAPPLSSEHLQAAIRDLEVVVDITPAELDAIARRAITHATSRESDLYLPVGTRSIRVHRGENLVIHKNLDDEENAVRGTVSLKVVSPKRD